jgi:hypothetical protein
MQKEVEEKIKALIEKYEKIRNSGRLKSYTEEETKNCFIIPLFEILGWDFSDKDEVSAEETISSQRVDYGFYIDGRIKFYLETKKLSADIHKEDFANQAIKYSWNKEATWAILTNFETLVIFNAQDIKRKLADKLYTEMPYNQYIERFDQLWLLSKESFKSNLLDRDAEIHGKKFIKVPVTSLLYEDLEKCRDMLTKDLGKMNEKINTDLLDEGVQKLLDRLIFIRVAEDRGIEDRTLIPLVRQARSGDKKFYESMVETFREFDHHYNSNLFQHHSFEQWEEYSGVTERVINILYGKEGYYEYDFKAMPADVLGAVYENYLGHRLSQSKKGVTVAKDAKKRKEHGIYYTPSFIVDYIAKNALGPILDKCKSVSDLNKIKVLDPACGSGSFLMKAMDLIFEKHKEFGSRGDEELVKIRILENNIYGVDLDLQAVEITRLNLLINALEKRDKLPFLNHIKNGNSLISGTDEELKKYFGNNFRDKKPFNWQEEFPEVFKQGGFNVIIGNPPYVRNRELEEKDKEFFSKDYVTASGQYDLYQLFFEQSLKLLKIDGFIGFITSNKYTIADYGKKLREYLLQNSRIISMVDVSNLDVFKDAATYPYVIVFKKDKENRGNIITAYRPVNGVSLTTNEIKISQTKLEGTESKTFVLKEENPLLEKIEFISEKLGDICTIKETIHTGNVRQKLVVDKKIDENCKKLLAGKDCHRYWFKWGGKWIRYDKNLIHKEKGEYANLVGKEYFEHSKLLLREISYNLEACYDQDGFYTLNKVYSIQSISKYKNLYLLVLLNSKLISFYFRNKFEGAHVQNNYLQVKKIYSSQIPIRKINFSNSKEKAIHDELAKLGKKITNLNKNLQEEEKGSNNYELLKSEIEKTDRKIDEEIYKLYDLAPEDIKIVEGQ